MTCGLPCGLLLVWCVNAVEGEQVLSQVSLDQKLKIGDGGISNAKAFWSHYAEHSDGCSLGFPTFPHAHNQYLTKQYFTCPRDCVVAAWGAWNACSTEYYDRTRVDREVNLHVFASGIETPASLTELEVHLRKVATRGMVDLLNSDYHEIPERAAKREEMRQAFECVSKHVHASAALGGAFANRALLAATFLVPFVAGASSATSGAPAAGMHPEDAAAVRRVAAGMYSKVPPCLRAGRDPCSCSQLACALVQGGGAGRGGAAPGAATVLELRATAFTGVVRGGPSYNGTTLAKLQALPYLEALHLSTNVGTGAGAEALCRELQALPKLRRLRLEALPGTALPAHCALPELLSVEGILGPAEGVAFVCNSPKLLSLDLEEATGLPECLGTSNTALLRIDVRGGKFGAAPPGGGGGGSEGAAPLPASLAGLVNLVQFVGFEQNQLSCPPADHAARSAAAGLGPCQPTYLWKAQRLTEEKPWQCPWAGWRARFDDPAAPWWGWRSIEMFWVDSNFFYGTIPAAMATRWPALRTLDLYDNDLSGTIPPEMGQMADLHQVLLHDNRLTGTVPAALLALPRLQQLQFSLNPELGGCTTHAGLAPGALLFKEHTAFQVLETEEACAAAVAAWAAATAEPHTYDYDRPLDLEVPVVDDTPAGDGGGDSAEEAKKVEEQREGEGEGESEEEEEEEEEGSTAVELVCPKSLRLQS